jgi:hypothetical protein
MQFFRRVVYPLLSLVFQPIFLIQADQLNKTSSKAGRVLRLRSGFKKAGYAGRVKVYIDHIAFSMQAILDDIFANLIFSNIGRFVFALQEIYKFWRKVVCSEFLPQNLQTLNERLFSVRLLGDKTCTDTKSYAPTKSPAILENLPGVLN